MIYDFYHYNPMRGKMTLDELVEMILEIEINPIRVWLYSGEFWKGNLIIQIAEDYINFNANKGYDFTSQHNLTVLTLPANNNALVYALAGTLYTMFWRDK